MYKWHELCQMIKFALKYYNGEDGQDTFRQVDLAPSENIFSLSCTKSMSLSLSPAQLLLPSSLTPPALRSRCSCPQPLQPSQKACPFTAQIEKARRRKAVVIAISASVDRSWPLLPSCGLAATFHSSTNPDRIFYPKRFRIGNSIRQGFFRKPRRIGFFIRNGFG